MFGELKAESAEQMEPLVIAESKTLVIVCVRF